jgi:hypothetical protein
LVKKLSDVPGFQRLNVVGERTTLDKLEGQRVIVREFIEVSNTKFGPQGGTYLRITVDVAGSGSGAAYKTYTFNTPSAQIRQTLMNARSNLPVQLTVCKIHSGNDFDYWILQS